jgi:hypothetical protein
MPSPKNLSAMITLGRYTFKDEAARAADYRQRVGPLKRPRTNTVERPDPDMTCAQWLDWLREEYERRWAVRHC